MSISSLKWHVIALFLTMMMPSLLSPSAAHSKAQHTGNSSLNSDCINEEVKEDEFHENLSFGARAAQILYGLIESGLKVVQKQRWKGLTIFLALQNSAAGAITANNLLQNFNFTDGEPIHFLPITNISGYASPCCIVEIIYSTNYGALTSTENDSSPSVLPGTFTLQRNVSELYPFLAGLTYWPVKGIGNIVHYKVIYLILRLRTIDRISLGAGGINLYPLMLAAINTANTSLTTHTQTETNTPTDTIIDMSNQSSRASRAETGSLNPNVYSQASKPPYEIIGGVVGGGVVLAIIGIAAFKLKTRKKSSDDESHNKQSGAQNNYDKVVEAPQKAQYDAVSAPFNSGYVGLPASALKNQYENLTLAAPHSASSSPLNAAYEEPPVSTRNNQYTPAPQPFAGGPAIVPVSARQDQYENLALTYPS